MRTFQFWISSPRNITFRYQETVTLEELGYDEEDWTEMSETDRDQTLEEYAQSLVFNRYIEYVIEEN